MMDNTKIKNRMMTTENSAVITKPSKPKKKKLPTPPIKGWKLKKPCCGGEKGKK